MARAFAFVLVSLAVAAYGAPDLCCNRLTTALSREKVISQLSPRYAVENSKYWSSTSILNPTCIVVPESSSDVSTAVKILVENNCEFGIRGGGHTPNPGWAGTDSGVLISLSKLNNIEVSEDKASVIIGAGNRWGDVYAKTGEQNVTVTGGRISTVGVSGFLLGGGLSFLMHKEGFGANSVLSYEIVLANGTIATVTAESTPDLFRALKGGTGNFGIVTSFKMQTYPINDVYAGNLYYSPDQYDKLFPIMEAYARQGIESDPKTHVISAFIHFPSEAIDMATFYSFYSEPVTAPPPAIRPFLEVPTILNTVKVKTVKQAADELTVGTINGLRYDLRDFTIRADAALYKELFDIWNSTISNLDLTPGWNSVIAFQPISNSMIRASNEKGGNVLGLEPASDPLIIVNYQFTWALPADDTKIYAITDKLIEASISIAKEKGQFEQYIYLNYASSNQQPLKSYGPGEVQFLREVKAKYDPNGVFEKLSRGGFKIPPS